MKTANFPGRVEARRTRANERQEAFNKLSTDEKIARNPKRADHYTKQAAQAATLAKLAKKEKKQAVAT